MEKETEMKIKKTPTKDVKCQSIHLLKHSHTGARCSI